MLKISNSPTMESVKNSAPIFVMLGISMGRETWEKVRLEVENEKRLGLTNHQISVGNLDSTVKKYRMEGLLK